ncbi:MAG: type II secretion system protein [Planctomycetota bacterium]|jgi:prepilin-type N-terminal cleavage/methylation domain-containing protein/prepilin-type processing-associated H-X9-DG protein
MKGKKAFTLVELLVVIAIIALLMSILMPALARVRSLAYRMLCGTNLSSIGKGIIMYSSDYNEDYPVAGGKLATWSKDGYLPNWDKPNDMDVFSIKPDGTGGQATITSCLYLLIRGEYLTPKQFVCRGDLNHELFGLTTIPSGEFTLKIERESQVWDFGRWPSRRCSYSYQMPFVNNEGSPIKFKSLVTIVLSGNTPVCADRNPWLDDNAYEYLSDPNVVVPTYKAATGEFIDRDKKWNCAAHQRDGQNVLFNDGHVEFMKSPAVGLQEDNIWRAWPDNTAKGTTPSTKNRILGGDPPTLSPNGAGVGKWEPNQPRDAYLVNEHQSKGR